MKLFKSKKVMSGLIASMVGVAILMTGMTFAWFTSSGSAASDFSMGTFGVQAELVDAEFPIMNPGEVKFNNIGWVRNTGNLAAVAELSLTVEVVLADGTVQTNPPAVSIELQKDGSTSSFPGQKVHPLGAWYRVVGPEFYIWGKGPGDKLFVAMDGNDKLHFAYTVKTNGPAMGNEYMGATIRVRLAWRATQVVPEGAFSDFFGFAFDAVDWDYFETFVELPSSVPFSLRTPAARFADRLNSLPEGAYKALLERKFADRF